ncbi:MAG: hypothetical protein ACR65O_14440 [Methylomicrobium sp.]
MVISLYRQGWTGFKIISSSWRAVLLQFGIAESLIVQVKGQPRLLTLDQASALACAAKAWHKFQALVQPVRGDGTSRKKYGQRQICAGIDKGLAFQALAPFGKVVHLSRKRQKTPNFARVRIKGIKAAKLTKIGKF